MVIEFWAAADLTGRRDRGQVARVLVVDRRGGGNGSGRSETRRRNRPWPVVILIVDARKGEILASPRPEQLKRGSADAAVVLAQLQPPFM